MGMEPHQSLSLATTGKNAAYANSVQHSLPSASKVATLPPTTMESIRNKIPLNRTPVYFFFIIVAQTMQSNYIVIMLVT